MKYLVLLTLLLLAESQVSPPVWSNHFNVDFVQSYSSSRYKIVGKMWYDWDRKMSRLDRTDGQFEGICSSILNSTSPCIQLVRDNKRYIIHTQPRICCVCCDSAHGCGILKKDWLKDAKYLGKEVLSGQDFNKFSIVDGDAMDYYWSTTDSSALPRRISEDGSRIKDFIMNTYTEEPIPDSVFALPSYCSDTLCPATSVCGKFQSKEATLEQK